MQTIRAASVRCSLRGDWLPSLTYTGRCAVRHTMTLEQFWSIVDGVHQASNGGMDRKCKLLAAELRKLGLDEARSFHGHFNECFDRAYTYDLWAAAYIIGGGCSDDGFSDFRGTLISMGRQTYERAVADPQSLADMDYDAESAQYEGYQYVPTTVETELSGGQMFPRARTHPDGPSGQPWDEDKVAELYPLLAKKYAYGASPRPWWKIWQ